MPSPPGASPERIKDVNVRYHDVAASTYDSKWGIDFGPVGQQQVLKKVRKALGEHPGRFADALEIGAGTGYFSLNLMQLGLIGHTVATDISPGMLAALERTAARLGLDVDTEVTEAEALPFADQSFDLVIGHAVLHHIPDLAAALSEFARVLRPGGALVFCGEPSRYGDAIAAAPKRGGRAAAPLWRRLVGASALGEGPQNGAAASRTDGADGGGNGGGNGEAGGAPGGLPSLGECLEDHGLESEVDVHAFAPGELRSMLREAGLGDVRVRGEELLASVYGWTLRALEASAEPQTVPHRWRLFAFRSYLALQRLDEGLLEPRLPPELFYNLVFSARRPD